VNQGVLRFTGGGSGGGAFATAADATTEFGGDYTLTDGVVLKGAGHYTHSGGTLKATGAVAVTNLAQSGGTLAGNGKITASTFALAGGSVDGTAGGELTVTDQFDWTSGSMTGGGKTTLGPGVTATIDAATSDGRDFTGREIVNQGTFNWNAANLRSGNGGKFTNAAGATFNDRNGAGYAVQNTSTGTFVFTNDGTYTRAAAGTTAIDATFDNNGSVDLQQGALELRGGGTMSAHGTMAAAKDTNVYFKNGYTLEDGAALHGQGAYWLVQGTLTADGAFDATNFNQTGGSLAGTHTLVGAFSWTGGDWNASTGDGTRPSTTILAGSTLDIGADDGSARAFDHREVVNRGIVNWHGGKLDSGDDGRFTNDAGGTFNDSIGEGWLQNSFGGNFTFTNHGAYVRDAAGTTYVNTTFDNDGTLTLKHGGLELHGGGTMGATSRVDAAAGTHVYFTNNYTIADGATFTGAGLFAHLAGTLTIDGTLSASGFQWSGGDWNATAGAGETTTIGTGTVLALSDANGGARVFDARTIVNHGIVNWYSGDLQSGHGGAFDNASDGVFNDVNASGDAIVNDLGGTFTFTNNGTYTKSTSATTTVKVPFTNNGTLSIAAGSMVFADTFTNNGNLVLAHGAAAQFAQSLSFGTSFLGGTGTITAPAVTAGGIVSPGNSPGMLTITGDFTLLNTSVLLIELSGTTQGTSYDYLNVGGNVALDGALEVKLLNGFGSSVVGADTFTILSSGGLGGLTGAFANVASGGRIFTLDGAGSFQVNYAGLDAVTLTNFQAVPEPSTYVLFGAGLLVVAAGLRRRLRPRRLASVD